MVAREEEGEDEREAERSFVVMCVCVCIHMCVYIYRSVITVMIASDEQHTGSRRVGGTISVRRVHALRV